MSSTSKRMIHGQLYESLTIAELTIRQRYLLTGMIVNADDQGRIVADPRWLKHKILPYDDILLQDISDDLEAIAAKNDTVIVYEVDGRPYAQFQNWWEYQSLQWAGPSDYPAPEDWQDKIRRLMYQPCRWVQTINWPGSKDVVSYEESPQSDDKSGRNSPNGAPTDDENAPTDDLGDESLRELDYASRSEQGDLLADTSAIYLNSNINLNDLVSGKEGAGEKPSGEKIEQEAWNASCVLVRYWCNLVGDIYPTTRKEQDRIITSHYGPMVILWQALEQDIGRACTLLESKRTEMLQAGLRPRRPAAVVPQIVGDLEAATLPPTPAKNGHKPEERTAGLKEIRPGVY